MAQRDIIGLLISYAYALSLLALGEVLRRVWRVPQELTRKLVHVGAGMWVFGVLALFESWQIGVVPFASFIAINYVLYRYRLSAALDDQRNNPGTVYFAAAMALLFALLWRPGTPDDRAPVAVAGAMALTWGDAAAALVGRRIGRHHYQVWGHQRSFEGSAALVLFSAVTIAPVLAWLPGSPLAPTAAPWPAPQLLAASLAAALLAALAEAYSPHGSDNLSVPLVAAGVVLLIGGL